MSKPAAEVVQCFFDEVWTFQRLDRIPAFIHPTYTVNGDTAGIEWVERNVRAYQQAFPDLRLTVIRLMADGTHVSSLVRLSGTHAGRWKGIEPSGRTFDVLEAAFWTVHDGLIHSGTFVADTLSLRVQLGQIPESVWKGTSLTMIDPVSDQN